jgi:hypothetical protein
MKVNRFFEEYISSFFRIQGHFKKEINLTQAEIQESKLCLLPTSCVFAAWLSLQP